MSAIKTTQFFFPVRDETRLLIGILSDEETTIGFLLAGIGESFGVGRENVNFKIVTKETPLTDVEHFFRFLYAQPNIGVILIAEDIWQKLQSVWEDMKHRGLRKKLPIIIDIPTRVTTSAKPRKSDRFGIS